MAWLPVRSGGTEEEGLERERAQVLGRRRRVRRDEAERKAVPQERDLLKPQGSAGARAVHGDGLAGHGLRHAVKDLRRRHVQVPERRVHGRPKSRHGYRGLCLSVSLSLSFSFWFFLISVCLCFQLFLCLFFSFGTLKMERD